MFEFDTAAKILAGVFGTKLIYTQHGFDEEFNIDIERNLEIVDEHTGGSQIISAAHIAVSEFPFDDVQSGDRIETAGRKWRVIRKLADDGYMMTLEIQ